MVPVTFRNVVFAAPISVVAALAIVVSVPWAKSCSKRTESPVAVPAPRPVSLKPASGQFAVAPLCPSTDQDCVRAATISARRAFQSAVVALVALMPGFQLEAGAL